MECWSTGVMGSETKNFYSVRNPTLHYSNTPVLHSALKQARRHTASAVLYRRNNGNRVIDVVELDESQLIRRARAFYADDQK
jgi:hypothetical protein